MNTHKNARLAFARRPTGSVPNWASQQGQHGGEQHDGEEHEDAVAVADADVRRRLPPIRMLPERSDQAEG
jgi:hypothetical protein